MASTHYQYVTKIIFMNITQDLTMKKILSAVAGAAAIIAIAFALFVAVAPSEVSAAWGSECGLGCNDGGWNPWDDWGTNPGITDPWIEIGGGGGGGGPTPQAPVCTSFTASPSSGTAGSERTLAWSVSGNPTSLSISPTVGAVSGASGSRKVYPTTSTTYVLTASNAYGSVTCQTSVTVVSQPAPTCALSATPTIGVKGTEFSLNWQVSYAASATISPTIGELPILTYPSASGVKKVTPANTTKYTLTVLGENGSTITCDTTVVVIPPPQAPICDFFKATPSSITKGSSTTLSWGTTNASSVSINQGIGTVAVDGSKSVSPTESKLYTLTATGAGGTATCSTYVTVTDPGDLACELIVDPTEIKKGGSAKLTWSSTNATNCTPTNFSTGGSLNGSTTVSPTGDTTYSMTCTRPGASGTGSWTKSYSDISDLWCPAPLPNTPPPKHIYGGVPNCPSNVSSASCSEIGSVCKVNSWAGPGATPATGSSCNVRTDLYRCDSVNTTNPYTPPTSVTCTAKIKVIEDKPAPKCTLNADKLILEGDERTTLRWTISNATQAFLQHLDAVHILEPKDGKWDSVPAGIYKLSISGPGGSDYCELEIKKKTPPPETPECTLDSDKNAVKEGDPVKLTWTTKNAVSVFITPEPGAVASNGSKSVTPLGLTTYVLTATAASGEKAICKKTVDTFTGPDPVPVCTLTPDKTEVEPGGRTTLRWTISYATEAFLQHLDAVHILEPKDGKWDSVPAGVYKLSVKDNKGRSDYCEVTITEKATPMCQLSLNKTSITTGDSVELSWTSSNVTSGFINNNVGTTSPVSSGKITLFPPESTTYVGTFTGPFGTTTCQVGLTVSKGPGGCTGNCGGGLNQPNVVLFKKPGEQTLSFVSLSQIPYTGFEAGPFLTALFWLAVMVWSVGMAYIFVGKGGLRFITERVLQLQPQGVRTYQEYDYDAAPQEPEVVETPVMESVAMPQQMPIAMPQSAPQPTQPAVDGVPALSDVLESRAHAAGVLLSPEALTVAATLAETREETLKQFGEILNEAVRSVPREDGWILLSSDRFNELRKKQGSTVAPVATPAPEKAPVHEVLDEGAAHTLVRAILSGDRDTAFSLVREHEKEGSNPTKLMTGAATLIDGLYCARRDGMTVGDLVLAERAAHLSEESLARLVEVLTHAIDGSYSSLYTGVKLAIAQAFDIVA